VSEYTNPATKDLEPCHVAPYYRDNTLVAQKLRFKDKEFIVLGDGKGLPLFGMNKWSRGARIVITEGELDALSVAQATGLKTPVVSLPGGASEAKKAISRHLDYLGNFDQIILWFDNDEAGQKAVRECVEVLPPGRARVVQTPPGAKDASDLLQKSRVKEIVDCVFQARPWRPDHLIQAEDLKTRVSSMRKTTKSIQWGHSGLDRMTRGIRTGEVTMLTAGVGAGKSTMVRELMYSMIRSGEAFAAYMLEDSVEDVALALVGLHLDRRLHLDDEDDESFLETEEFSKAYDEVFQGKAAYLFDNRGHLDLEALETQIRHAARHLEARWVFLDNVTSLMASGAASDDERRAIDAVMMSMASLAKELGIGIIVVCHLRRPEGEKGYENGKEVTANALRGSGALMAFSNTVVALERDQQDEEDRNRIRARVLKCRWTGKTGLAGFLVYDGDTGRLEEDSNSWDKD
jgi:twinkle protein